MECAYHAADQIAHEMGVDCDRGPGSEAPAKGRVVDAAYSWVQKVYAYNRGRHPTHIKIVLQALASILARSGLSSEVLTALTGIKKRYLSERRDTRKPSSLETV